MATENEPVETVEIVHVEPTADDETVDGGEGDAGAAEGAAEGASEEGAAPEGGTATPKETIVRRQPGEAEPIVADAAPAVKAGEGGLTEEDLAEVPGETPRERGLRLEVKRLRGIGRKDRANELLGNPPAPAAGQKKELSPAAAEVLKKYKPAEISALREVLPALAEEMGFVKADQLNAQTYEQTANAEFESFLEKHPEYLPENDKDNVLYTQFKNEFALYNKPANPKDYRKIFDRVHKEVFGIQATPGKGGTAIQAQQRKVSSASHTGASATTRPVTPPAKTNKTGLRLDMLKGFSDADIAELTAE